MDVVELDCPSCGTMLEVDRGFAGGVCRCSHCGALLTVPSQAGGRAETLSRPERPGRPDHPGGPVTSSSRPATPNDMPLADETVAEDDLAPSPPPTTYTTASGRTVEVSGAMRIPTARQRRKVVRTTTYAVIITIVLVLVSGSAVGIYLLLQSIDATTRRNTASPDVVDFEDIYALTYDPVANPLLLKEANVLGLPLLESTAVVLDLSAASEPWAQDVVAMLASGAANVKPGRPLQYIVAHESKVEAIAAELRGWESSSLGQLRTVAQRLTPQGNPDYVAAVKRALQEEPKQLVMILGRDLDGEAVGQIVEACGKHPQMQVNIFTIDVEILDLSDLAREREGEARLIPRNRLNTWTRDAKSGADGTAE